MKFRRTLWMAFAITLSASAASGQNPPSNPPQPASPPIPQQSHPALQHRPQGDDQTSLPGTARTTTANPPDASSKVSLLVPANTPLRVALVRRARINHFGEPIEAEVVEAVYAFDQIVIPAGSMVTGHVVRVLPLSPMNRALAYANGDLTPIRQYRVAFDELILPDSKRISVSTTVSRGSAEVVHLVSDPDRAKQQKGVATKAAEKAKQEAKGKIQDAKDTMHQAVEQVKTPGKMYRLKEYFLAELPYHRQYIETGTRFNAELDAPLDFGTTTRSAQVLAAIGAAPPAESLLQARLEGEVTSATAHRGTPVSAVVTAPLYSQDHSLILPANSRLVGEVLQAKPAGKLHHNGDLRVTFERIILPDGPVQTVHGSLEGAEVDRAARLNLDAEGGAHATDSKTRCLSTGLSIAIAAASARPDIDHGTIDPEGDPGVRTVAGGSGMRLVGALVSFAAESHVFSAAFGAYGASRSIYANFLSRGREAVLQKDTPVEIGFGGPHPGSAARKN
ncbi:MAG TPA: hypothetical protein VIH76_20010 [Candidatus Acidoferrales bacterium]